MGGGACDVFDAYLKYADTQHDVDDEDEEEPARVRGVLGGMEREVEREECGRGEEGGDFGKDDSR